MNRKYLYILITYIAMQLSSVIGMPLTFAIGTEAFGADPEKMKVWATGGWLVFIFIVALLVILMILRKYEPMTRLEREQPMTMGWSIVWGIAGIFIALFSQSIAISIEQAIGIEPGSENTQDIIQMIEVFPLLIIVSSLIGPILEEIVFRKVIFGSLYNRFSFWVSALISSAIFSVAHREFTHFILYAAMGFVFAFLYVKTKRIIVPIIAHVMMNTLVVVLQFFLADKLQEYIDQMEKVQSWIGGFFL